MTLRNIFSLNNLTNSQNCLITELESFLTNHSPIFILKGYAGTGKTFMMKGFTEFLTANNRAFQIAAPTGRAAKVISQKTHCHSRTIHKLIYSAQDIKEYKVTGEDGSETFKFYYDIKNNENPANTIYIIDEASMISNMYSEGEFFRFGSGFLLNDLLRYINIDNNDHCKKIIFIGDDAQLPPINMKFSPALDHKYFKELCGVEAMEFELTDVVRQRMDSGILTNANKIRKYLKNNFFNQLDIDTNYIDIKKTKPEDLLSSYLTACNNTIDEETIIIAYSNASVKEYNDFVRQHFFPNQQFITEGDKVILVNNNYNQIIELLNGDFGRIQQVSQFNDIRTIKLKKENAFGKIIEVDIKLTFRDVNIEFNDDENKIQIIACKIIENLLYSKNRELTSDELKALYIDFKIRNGKLKPGSKEFKDALRSDLYFNALHLKFGYAITCHKAQGGEWKNTFLNCKTSMGYFNSSYFRWLYTGITRAKDSLFTIDEPHFKIGENLKLPKFENISPRQDILILNYDLLELEIPFELPSKYPFIKTIFHAVNEYLKDANLNIESIKHTDYLEHYLISDMNDKVVFKIHYNSQSKISRIEKPLKSTQLAERIYTLLSILENKTILVSEEDVEALIPSNKQFVFEKSYLQVFYENVKFKLETLNIIIVSIEHKPYHEIYTFTKNGLAATYKFHYNGKGIFQKTEVIPGRTTGLIDEINSLLI